MTKRRKFSPEKKFQIVMEGLRGRPVSELCNAHQITQSQYYLWRDQFLKGAPRAFTSENQSTREASLREENRKLKAMVGELTMELKKSEWEL